MYLNKLSSWRLLLVLGLIPLFWVGASSSTWLKSLEGLTLNWRFKLRGDTPSSAKLIYVDIDSDSMDAMGERPIPRAFFAKAVEALVDEGHAKVVGVNLIFSDDSYSSLVDESKVLADTKLFSRTIKEYPQLVLASAYSLDDELSLYKNLKIRSQFPYLYLGFEDEIYSPELPAKDLTQFSEVNIGLTDIAEHYSPGSIPRWLPLYSKAPEGLYLSMALEMARVYYNIPKQNVLISEDYIVLKDVQNNEILSVPLTQGQLIEVNWFSKWISPENPRVSFKEVLQQLTAIKTGNSAEKAQAQEFFQQFEGAAILIGIVDPLLKDVAATPFSPVSAPRVGIHGNLFKTITSGAYLYRLPTWANALITIVLTFIVLCLAVLPSRRGALLKVASALCLVVYLFLVYYLFKSWNCILPVIAPLYAAITTTFLGIIYQLARAEQQKTHIHQLFGTYVSPDVVNQMVIQGESPKLGGLEQNITALFSDVEGFTSITEGLSPKQVVVIMNEYFSAMTDVIQEERGTLDKYIGDAVVAIYGAPLSITDHAFAACRSSCKMQQKQLELCEKWKADNQKWPSSIWSMRTRIGINTGPAVVGNMGSSKRFNYTMMGDDVNLAARFERAASVYGINSMVSAHTRSSAESVSDEILFRCLDRLVVKGSTSSVEVHEIVGFRSEQPQIVFDYIENYENALNFYFDQEWSQAIKFFEIAQYLEQELPGHYLDKSSVSQMFKLRCEILQNNPVLDSWNGVFVVESK